MLAFINTSRSKAQMQALMSAHARADRIRQGAYTNGLPPGSAGFRGCLIGCAANGDHAKLERMTGIPSDVLYLADDIFDGLTRPNAKAFAAHFFDNVVEGSDLARVHAKWCYWAINDPVDGLVTLDSRQFVLDACTLFHRSAEGDEPTDKEWDAVERVVLDAWQSSNARDRVAHVFKFLTRAHGFHLGAEVRRLRRERDGQVASYLLAEAQKDKLIALIVAAPKGVRA